ncbi:MAG: hypothetical protein ABEJ59_00875 [Halanaeroarchaeum sp.]
MIERFTTALAYAAYQTSVALGIALLPVAVLANELGLTLPVNRLIERTEVAYRTSR